MDETISPLELLELELRLEENITEYERLSIIRRLERGIVANHRAHLRVIE